VAGATGTAASGQGEVLAATGGVPAAGGILGGILFLLGGLGIRIRRR